MRLPALAFSVFLTALPLAGARAERPKVPFVNGPHEQEDPEFRRDPSREDLQTLVIHLRDCVTHMDVPEDTVPGLDFFLTNLEKRLREDGNDIPRDRILRNADKARERLRRAYNDLSEVMQPQMLPEIHDKLKEVGEQLPPLQERNRGFVKSLQSLAATGRATAGGMQIKPPDSPGQKVPLDLLSDIEPLRPELVPLREKLREATKKLKEVKAYILRSKESVAYVESLADKAASLDKDAVNHLNERRTRGVPTRYQIKMQSQAVILNANKSLKRVVQKAEDLVAQIEAQVDPKKPGIRKAIEDSVLADLKTQDGKELEYRSGDRINFNHGRRMNIEIEGVIRRGWEAAADKKKAWWEGRARMAKSESEEDGRKMTDAWRAADKAAERAEQSEKEAAEALERIDRGLGSPESDSAKKIAKRPLRVPDPRDIGGSPNTGVRHVKSKGIKIPHTLDVSNKEILQSYDNGNDPPDGNGPDEKLPDE